MPCIVVPSGLIVSPQLYLWLSLSSHSNLTYPVTIIRPPNPAQPSWSLPSLCFVFNRALNHYLTVYLFYVLTPEYPPPENTSSKVRGWFI